MSSLQLAQIHNAEVELQQLVTRRLAMVAANHECELKSQPPRYLEADFEQLATQIGYTAVPQEQFGN